MFVFCEYMHVCEDLSVCHHICECTCMCAHNRVNYYVCVSGCNLLRGYKGTCMSFYVSVYAYMFACMCFWLYACVRVC